MGGSAFLAEAVSLGELKLTYGIGKPQGGIITIRLIIDASVF